MNYSFSEQQAQPTLECNTTLQMTRLQQTENKMQVKTQQHRIQVKINKQTTEALSLFDLVEIVELRALPNLLGTPNLSGRVKPGM